MELVDILALLAIVAILLGAVLYVRRSKKKGQTCIGCPNGGNCSGSCAGYGGCSCKK